MDLDSNDMAARTGHGRIYNNILLQIYVAVYTIQLIPLSLVDDPAVISAINDL